MKEEIGHRIRKLRTAQSFSQATMAGELGITAGAFAKIERGETDPSITRLFQIADILKVSINDIIEEDPNGKGAKNLYILENQIKRLLTEMELIRKELKKLPKPKK